MNFISDLDKLKKIKEMASNGDEKAKNFLFTFMDMPDEEANAFLAEISVEKEPEQAQPVKEELKQIVEALVKDENEAIDGYDKAIKFIANSDLPELVKTAYIGKLEHIKAEEIEHIEELKEIL